MDEMIITVWSLIFVIILIIVIMTIQQVIVKPPFRKYRYLQIKKSLDEENKKLITDKEDIEQLELLLSKFGWYAKRWYVNLTPTYQSRWNKFKKIVNKYNLDIELFDYKEEEK